MSTTSAASCTSDGGESNIASGSLTSLRFKEIIPFDKCPRCRVRYDFLSKILRSQLFISHFISCHFQDEVTAVKFPWSWTVNTQSVKIVLKVSPTQMLLVAQCAKRILWSLIPKLILCQNCSVLILHWLAIWCG